MQHPWVIHRKKVKTGVVNQRLSLEKREIKLTVLILRHKTLSKL